LIITARHQAKKTATAGVVNGDLKHLGSKSRLTAVNYAAEAWLPMLNSARGPGGTLDVCATGNAAQH
jgi:hypothetical protein